MVVARAARSYGPGLSGELRAGGASDASKIGFSETQRREERGGNPLCVPFAALAALRFRFLRIGSSRRPPSPPSSRKLRRPRRLRRTGWREVGAAFPGGSRGAYANSLGVCGDDGAVKEFVLVAGDDVVDGAGHLCGSEAGEPDDSRVRQAFNNGKFPKVLVQGDENPPFRVGRSENCRITGILRPCSRPDSVVTEIAEELAEPLPRHRNQERWPASGSQSGGKEFYSFMARQPGGVDEAGLDILGFQPWVSLKDGFRGVAGGKHVKNVFHGQTPAPDDRLAAKDFRIAGDSLEQLVLVHGEKRRRKTQDFKTQDAREEVPVFRVMDKGT